MANHSSILAWRIPWTGDPGGLHPWGCKTLNMTEQLSTVDKYFLVDAICLSFWFLWSGKSHPCSPLRGEGNGDQRRRLLNTGVSLGTPNRVPHRRIHNRRIRRGFWESGDQGKSGQNKWFRNEWSGPRTRRCAGQRRAGSEPDLMHFHQALTVHREQGTGIQT